MPTKGQRRFERRLAARRAAALAPEHPAPSVSDTLDLDARLRRALGNRLPRQR